MPPPSDPRRPRPRTCPGYAERAGKCPNPRGSPWSDRWCLTCDRRRIDDISARLAELAGAAVAGEEDTEDA